MPQESSTDTHRSGAPAIDERAIPIDTAAARSFESAPALRPVAAGLVLPLSSTGAPHPTASPPLLRQMRARLAFERASTRLYEAFLDKLDASPDTGPRSQRGALNRDTVVRFRNEEAAHFELLCESLESMGADPLAELREAGKDARPAIDTAALESKQVDAAQALDALLDAEQTDEAGWQRLVATAHANGLDELAHRFEQAHSEEIGHVRQLRAWQAMLPSTGRHVA